MPRSQFEISFDVIVQNSAASTLDRWDTFKCATDGTSKAIYIEHNSNSLYKTFAFNNAKAITWEPTMAADDMLRGTMTFKFSATTELGAANLKTSAAAKSTISW